MEKKNVLYALFIVGLMAVFAYMVLATDFEEGIGISLESPNASDNISGSRLILNATVNSSSLTNLTFIFYNYTDGAYVWNLTFASNGVVGAGVNLSFYYTYDTSEGGAYFNVNLSDGVYFLMVNHTNGVNTTVANNSSFFYIDNTVPSVIFNTPNGTFVGRTGGTNNGLLNFSVTFVNDTGFCGFYEVNLSNGTGGTFNLSGSTVLVTDSGNNDYNITFNLSYLKEGENYLYAMVNDTAGNLNNTEYIRVYKDTTPPLVNLTIGQAHDNYTWTDDFTPSLQFNFVDDTSPNASCELFIAHRGSAIPPYYNETTGYEAYGVNETARNNTVTTLTANHSVTEGVNYWYVNCTDLGGNMNSSYNATSGAGVFVLEVTNLSIQTPLNGAWTTTPNNGSVDLTFKFISQLDGDNVSDASCELFIDNESAPFHGSDINRTVYNNTWTTLKNTNYSLATGNINWTINCTWNSTQITAVHDSYYTLQVDNITPTVSLSQDAVVTTSTVIGLDITTSSDAQSCTSINRPGASISGTGASQTLIEGGLASNTAYSYTVQCCDASGRCKQATDSFSTDSTTGTSGGGGSGGGVSSGVTGQSAQKTWGSINAGETASVPVVNGEIGVTEVSFVAEATTYGAWIKVEKMDALPSTVGAYAGKVYKNVKISENNINKAIKDQAKIKFKVAKTWLTENKIGRDNVVVMRFVDGAWTELETAFNSDDGTYIHYTALTPGFSYFLIGEKVGAESVETPEGEAGEMPEGEAGETGEAVEEGMAPAKSSAWLWVIVGLVALAIVVWLVWFRKK